MAWRSKKVWSNAYTSHSHSYFRHVSNSGADCGLPFQNFRTCLEFPQRGYCAHRQSRAATCAVWEQLIAPPKLYDHCRQLMKPGATNSR
jgi:hypothetical protein